MYHDSAHSWSSVFLPNARLRLSTDVTSLVEYSRVSLLAHVDNHCKRDHSHFGIVLEAGLIPQPEHPMEGPERIGARTSVPGMATASCNYSMGRYLQRPSPFDCMHSGVGLNSGNLGYGSYSNDWGLVHGTYSPHSVNTDRQLNRSQGSYLSMSSSKDYSINTSTLSPSYPSPPQSGRGAFDTTGGTDSYNSMCNPSTQVTTCITPELDKKENKPKGT